MRVRAMVLALAGTTAAAGVLLCGSEPTTAAPAFGNPVIFVQQAPSAFGPPIPGYLNGYIQQFFNGFGAPMVESFGGNLCRLDPNGTVTNLTRRFGASVRDPEISFDGQRVMFAMKLGSNVRWQLYEMNVDGTGERLVSPSPAHNDMDPAYLPDGRILFTSDRARTLDPYSSLPTAQLLVMNADGSDVRTLSTNPGGELSPTVMSTGEVSFVRWDVKTRHPKSQVGLDASRFQLWTMNPDGTNDGHPAFGPHTITGFGHGYLQAREIPDGTGRFVANASRDPFFNGAGALVTLDPAGNDDLHEPLFITDERGYTSKDVVHRYRDPYPTAGGRLLASISLDHSFEQFHQAPPGFGLAVLDMDGNSVQVIHDDPFFWEWQPVEVAPRPVPPVIASTLDLTQQWGVLNTKDIGLRGHNPDVAAPDRQRRINDTSGLRVRIYQGEPGDGSLFGFSSYARVRPTEIGDAEVRSDGSFAARVPAGVPLLWEVRDAGGKVLVRERFWNQVLPGQTQTCSGCHSPHDETEGHTTNLALADPTDLFRTPRAPQMANASLRATRAVLDDDRALRARASLPARRLRGLDRKMSRAERWLARAEKRMASGRSAAALRLSERAGRAAVSLRKSLSR